LAFGLFGALALSAERAAGPVSRVSRLFECSEWRAQIDMETSLFAKWVRDEPRALNWAGEDGVLAPPFDGVQALVAFPAGANS
jgi:hypothetical protein